MLVDASEMLDRNPHRASYGIAVGDLEGDGRSSVFVTGFGGPNLVLQWRDGALVDVADDVIGDPTRHAIGVACGDLDVDGNEEVYVLNSDTFAGSKQLGDRLFARRGGEWVDLFGLPQNAEWLNLIAGRSVAALDRTGRGRYGFVVANYGGPIALFELRDDGTVRDVASDAGLAHVAGGRALLALPLLPESLATGRMDVFAGNENSPNFLFANRGDGTFEEVAERYGITDPDEHVRGAVALDANDDGLFDLVYGNWEGPHRFFLQSSLGLFGDIASPAWSARSRVRSVIAADFDNDGYEELFMNNIGMSNRLFRRVGMSWVAADPGAALEPEGLGTGAAVADVDGDGRLELIVAHGESALAPLGIYKARPNENRWLRVAPRTAAGAPARGAAVRVRAGGRVHLRAIDAGSGYLCQMEPVAHVGLGPDPVRIDSVEVVWPGGRRLVIDDVAVDTTLHVPFPIRA
ncbi:MAG TPA: CRTAC1 family protein [Acidimicrobiales bacterium]|nr:CRTAC1 family protein [Acidimicrobiales bacterium]